MRISDSAPANGMSALHLNNIDKVNGIPIEEYPDLSPSAAFGKRVEHMLQRDPLDDDQLNDVSGVTPTYPNRFSSNFANHSLPYYLHSYCVCFFSLQRQSEAKARCHGC